MAETKTQIERQPPHPKSEAKPNGEGKSATGHKPPLKRMVQAPVGCPVQWFSLGTGAERPSPATVLDHMGPDTCTVEIHSTAGIRVVPSCPHLSDPMLVLHPEMPGVEPDGAWDYIPDMPGLRPEEDRDLDSRAVRAVQLAVLHHWTTGQIAKATRMSEEAVEELLDRHARGK